MKLVSVAPGPAGGQDRSGLDWGTLCRGLRDPIVTQDRVSRQGGGWGPTPTALGTSPRPSGCACGVGEGRRTRWFWELDCGW